MSTMRGSLGRLAIGSSNNCNYLYSAFSTFSGGGRGRGGGFGPPNPQLGATGKLEPLDGDDNGGEVENIPSGLGHGRGKPIIPATNSRASPALSSWMPGVNPPSVGRERLIQEQPSPQQQLQSSEQLPRLSQQQHQRQQQQAPRKSSLSQYESQSFSAVKPFGFSRQDSSELNQNALPGVGRGKPIKMSGKEERPQEENRHIQPPRQPAGDSRQHEFRSQQRTNHPSSPRLSHEDAAKRAVEILSRGGGGGFEGGRGFRGGRGGGGRGRGRGGRGRGGQGDEEEEDVDPALYLGDSADGENLASRLGPDKMNQLAEGFEEICTRVLPSPLDEAYLDALHTNNLIEFEPEYLMGDFNSNPDIDEKPPVPLREKLEKAKPFLMAYEGIQSQEEWEKIVEETMVKVPQMEKLIDMYSGPDIVTAKEQKQELERIVAVLPEKAPSSVKRFASNAALTLENNPGWGFEKKCQFMNMLGREVSKSYK